MAKVFPLFLVVVLAVSVLLFAIPTQEQAANAYVNNDTTIMQYQVDNTTSFENIPATSAYAYKFQFDFSSGYKPFSFLAVVLKTSRGDILDIIYVGCEYFGGVLYLRDYDMNLDIEYSTSLPCRLELILGRKIAEVFELDILINTEYLGSYEYEASETIFRWDVYFLDENMEPYGYDLWENAPLKQFAVHYTRVLGNTRNVYFRSWVTDARYDAGYVDGMNAAQTATVNVFPAVIGSIFAFFMSIANYEVLGISLLNIMIIVGSVLLLLAVLRVFLK